MMTRRPHALLAVLCVALLAATKPDAADLLPAKGRWAGTEGRDQSHARSHDRAARLRVTDRDGAAFTAEYWIDRTDGLRLKGTVAADGRIDCVPVEILKGQWARNILTDRWHGTATADAVTLTRKLSGNGGERTVALKPAKGNDD